MHKLYFSYLVDSHIKLSGLLEDLEHNGQIYLEITANRQCHISYGTEDLRLYAAMDC